MHYELFISGLQKTLNLFPHDDGSVPPGSEALASIVLV